MGSPAVATKATPGCSAGSASVSLVTTSSTWARPWREPSGPEPARPADAAAPSGGRRPVVDSRVLEFNRYPSSMLGPAPVSARPILRRKVARGPGSGGGSPTCRQEPWTPWCDAWPGNVRELERGGWRIDGKGRAAQILGLRPSTLRSPMESSASGGRPSLVSHATDQGAFISRQGGGQKTWKFRCTTPISRARWWRWAGQPRGSWRGPRSAERGDL
jgi:hypothetical protein